MIEIKIPTAAAVVLLTQRMHHELSMREKAGQVNAGTNLRNLSFEELREIAEFSAFDIVALLPADIMSEENNLPIIISKAIKALSSIMGIKEFENYSEDHARTLLNPLAQSFKKIDDKNYYLMN